MLVVLVNNSVAEHQGKLNSDYKKKFTRVHLENKRPVQRDQLLIVTVYIIMSSAHHIMLMIDFHHPAQRISILHCNRSIA